MSVQVASEGISGDVAGVALEPTPPAAAARAGGVRRPAPSSVLFCAAVLLVQGAWLSVLGYLAFRFL